MKHGEGVLLSMSRWSDQFEGVAVNETLAQLGDLVDVEVDDVDESLEVEKRRFKKSIQIISEVVNGLDPEFFPDRQLSQLNQHLQNAQFLSNLIAHSSSPTLQRMREANDHLTLIIPEVFQLAAISRQPKAREAIRAVEQAYDTFCASLVERQKKIEALLDESRKELARLGDQSKTLATSHNNLEHNIEAALASLKSEHSSAQSERAEAFSKAQIDRGTKFDDSVREWRNKSEAEVKEISSKHTDLL